jgi:hypothetical protein
MCHCLLHIYFLSLKQLRATIPWKAALILVWVNTAGSFEGLVISPLTPNDLKRRRAVSPLKIKIPSKNMREKPTNTPIIHSVY